MSSGQQSPWNSGVDGRKSAMVPKAAVGNHTDDVLAWANIRYYMMTLHTRWARHSNDGELQWRRKRHTERLPACAENASRSGSGSGSESGSGV